MPTRHELPVVDLVRRYAEGATLRTLAADYGVATGTIRQRLNEAGAELRQRGAPRQAVDLEELSALVGTCGSARQAARALGIGRSTVQRQLRPRAEPTV